MDDNVTEEGPDELSTISGAHRSHREYRDGTKQEHGRKPSRDYQSSPRESPRDGNTGIGIQFKTHPSSGILFVTSILKDGPSQNKGIITGDVVAEVDGIDVLDRAGAAKPWPFEKVSPLIKGTPGSVVSIAFLRPASSEHEEAGQKIPEGQLFRVKIRRQDKRSSAPASPRSTHLPGGGLAGPGVGWSGDTGGGGGAGLASPRAIGRLADDDSDVGRPDVSIEARLQAHARGAVNAAAMARKLMTTGAVRASASSELQSAGLASRTQQQHHSLPASAGPAMRADVGRRAHSEVLAQGGRGVAAGGGGRRIDRNHPVSSAERMLIANEVAMQQRELRLRLRALTSKQEPSDKANNQTAAADEDLVEHPPLPLHEDGIHRPLAAHRALTPVHGEGAREASRGDKEKSSESNEGVFSAKELQELDRARILKRLLASRASRPHSTIKGYGDHQAWIEEVETRRKSARARPPTTGRISARQDERIPLKPQQPTKWHEECVEMCGQVRNCVTQAIKAI